MTVQKLVDMLVATKQPHAVVSVTGVVTCDFDHDESGYHDVPFQAKVVDVRSTHPNVVRVKVVE